MATPPKAYTLLHAPSPPDLKAYWARRCGSDQVRPFFHETDPDLGSLSNFYVLPRTITFAIPHWCWHPSLENSQSTAYVEIEHAEKAIMLCKAALFGDVNAFQSILRAQDPQACKALGRKVQGFDQDLWDCSVCSIALEVTWQKFSHEALEAVRRDLLATEDDVLAETNPRDPVWGIALSRDDSNVQRPARWAGANVLGWALMQTRERLRLTLPQPPNGGTGAAIFPPLSSSPSSPSQCSSKRPRRAAYSDDEEAIVQLAHWFVVHSDHDQVLQPLPEPRTSNFSAWLHLFDINYISSSEGDAQAYERDAPHWTARYIDLRRDLVPGATLKRDSNASSECIADFLVTLSKFRNLETLQLLGIGTHFTPGWVPVAVADMSLLKSLFLGACNLEGAVPAFLRQLPLLKDLDLSCNNFDLPDNARYFTNGGYAAVHHDISHDDEELRDYYALLVFGTSGTDRFSVADLLESISPLPASASQAPAH